MRKKRKTGDFINIVAYGGGTNSTAMLVGMYHRGIPVDLILFSDTGGEQPHTYEYIPIMNNWLTGHGMPEITVVENVDCNGDRLSLETECLRSGSLPTIAYGHKNCSLKHKTGPQDKFCNNYPPCKAVWAEGEKVVKFIGFDAGEERKVRVTSAEVTGQTSSAAHLAGGIKSPLFDSPQDCQTPKPPAGFGSKGATTVPSPLGEQEGHMGRTESSPMRRTVSVANHAIFAKIACALDWSWAEFVEADKNQTAMCALFAETDLPCGCYDGE